MPLWRRALAAVVVVAIVTLYVRTLARLRKAEPREETPWFGYARDAVNLGGVGGLVATFAIAGFGGPGALVVGVALGLALYLADWLLGKQLAWRAAPWILSALGVAIGVAAIALAPSVSALVARLIAVAAAR